MHSHTECGFYHKTNVASKKKIQCFIHSLLGTNLLHYRLENEDSKGHQRATVTQTSHGNLRPQVRWACWERHSEGATRLLAGRERAADPGCNRLRDPL